jgi:hypothetical protein
MADLRCPNCYDNLGKDKENTNPAYCGNCGEDNISNPRGYRDDEESDEEQAAHLAFARKNLR